MPASVAVPLQGDARDGARKPVEPCSNLHGQASGASGEDGPPAAGRSHAVTSARCIVVKVGSCSARNCEVNKIGLFATAKITRRFKHTRFDLILADPMQALVAGPVSLPVLALSTCEGRVAVT